MDNSEIFHNAGKKCNLFIYKKCEGGAALKKWEYKVVDSTHVAGGIFRGKKFIETERYFNQLGQEGWEIINIDFNDVTGQMDFVGVLKRELDTK